MSTLEQSAEQHDVLEKTIRNWANRFVKYQVTVSPNNDARSRRFSKQFAGARDVYPEGLTEGLDEWGNSFSDLRRLYSIEGYRGDHSVRPLNRLVEDGVSRVDCSDRDSTKWIPRTPKCSWIQTAIIEGGRSIHRSTSSRSTWMQYNFLLTLSGARSHPRVWNTIAKIRILVVVSHTGHNGHVSTYKDAIAQHALPLISPLIRAFGKKLLLSFDRTAHCHANVLWDIVGAVGSVQCIIGSVGPGEMIALSHFPYHSHVESRRALLELTQSLATLPIEELPALKCSLSKRLFGSLNLVSSGVDALRSWPTSVSLLSGVIFRAFTC